MTFSFRRRTLRPAQKATSEVTVDPPAAVATWAGGLLLYSACSAATFPLITAAFHCSRGGNTATGFAVGCGGACPAQYDERIATANISKARATHRRRNLMCLLPKQFPNYLVRPRTGRAALQRRVKRSLQKRAGFSRRHFYFVRARPILDCSNAVSYTHLRAHETDSYL